MHYDAWLWVRCLGTVEPICCRSVVQFPAHAAAAASAATAAALVVLVVVVVVVVVQLPGNSIFAAADGAVVCPSVGQR